MAEPRARRSPLEPLTAAMDAAGVEGPRGVTLRELPLGAQVNLRLDPADARAVRAVAEALSLPLPTEPNTVAGDERRAALWLGPDEWLVVGPDGAAGEIERALREALAGAHGSVVDLSSNRVALALAGPMAREVLMKGCALDLHPRRFAAGTCAQTALARAPVVLWPVSDEPAYRVLVRPSFSLYLTEWLIDAMAEYRASQAWMSTVWSSVSVSIG